MPSGEATPHVDHSQCHWLLAVLDVSGRLAETGSGNKSQLVACERARLEQRGGMLTFGKIMKFLAYYTANFPH